ncbi:MAG: histidine ammonia-lyase, partial [Saprospiraceae bacterium]
AFLEKKLKSTDIPFYGINTGFGSLCDVKVSDQDLELLQLNLVRSHACGMGDRVPDEISRMILFLKIKNMSLGYSGVRGVLVDKMMDIYNKGIVPTIYELGSLGASGDLAPLAHLGLTIIGEDINNPGPAFALKEKEGLSILNGTQFSTAYASWCTIIGEKLYTLSNTIAAISLEAFRCDHSPFYSAIHMIRPHAGHAHCATHINELRDNSPLSDLPEASVQDPYSFRCIPQVHGASYDAIKHVKSILEIEINSVTDNPIIVPEEDKIISGGNFHAQPLAMAIDYLTMALSELGSISERRIYQLINGDRDLPHFLVKDAGLNSGFMIVQYTAASITSQNKQLTMPASTDSIISCKGQEDHVSMAANAATKCFKVLNNLKRILSLELLVASQALEFRRPHKSTKQIEEIVSGLRKTVTVYEQDRLMHNDILAAENYLDQLISSTPIS